MANRLPMTGNHGGPGEVHHDHDLATAHADQNTEERTTSPRQKQQQQCQ
jgi:hypothetical protein